MRMKALNIVVTLLAIVGGLMHATAASFTVQAPRQVIQGNNSLLPTRSRMQKELR